jgi:hypothetical protein
MIPRTPSGILSPAAIVIDFYFRFGIEWSANLGNDLRPDKDK